MQVLRRWRFVGHRLERWLVPTLFSPALTTSRFRPPDYIKFTYPLVHVLASIAWGGIDHGAGYDGSSQTAYLDSTLRWGLDWMIKAHPSANTLYVQVGQASVDNK